MQSLQIRDKRFWCLDTFWVGATEIRTHGGALSAARMQCACTARTVQLFGRLAVVETHTLWYFGHHCCLVVGFDALGIWHFWIFTLFHPFPLFCTHFFHRIYSFSRLIDMVIHFQGAYYKTPYFPPHIFRPTFSINLSIGDRVFYTCSNGLRPATVVGTAEDGLLRLEYYQDGLRVVNRQCKMVSISFAIPSSDSPPDCPPSPPPNTQSSSPPKAPSPSPLPQEPGRPPSRSPPVQFGPPTSKGVSKGRA